MRRMPMRIGIASFATLLLACGGAPAPTSKAPSSSPAASSSITQAEAPAPSDPPIAKSVGRPHMLPGTSIEFLGGDGSSQKQAVLIHGAIGERDGVAAEYRYLDMLYGPEGERWNRREQTLLDDGAHGGRSYDELDFDLDGKRATIFFDITEYFGK